MGKKVFSIEDVLNGFKYDFDLRNIDQKDGKKYQPKLDDNGIIHYKDSVSSFVQQKYRHRLTGSHTKCGLELETWIYNNSNYDIVCGFSDFPPSYVVNERLTEIDETQQGYQKSWKPLISVLPRKKVYMVSNLCRETSGGPVGKLGNGYPYNPYSWEELMDLIKGIGFWKCSGYPQKLPKHKTV